MSMENNINNNNNNNVTSGATNEHNFTLRKTTPNDVIFYLSPINNVSVRRLVRLTNKAPQIALPEEWALGVLFNDGVYSLYKNGDISFDDNDMVFKRAFEKGVYFDDAPDFEPAKVSDLKDILAIVKAGNRKNIQDAIEKYGREKVLAIVTQNVGDLSTNLVAMLESIFKVQLVVADDDIGAVSK